MQLLILLLKIGLVSGFVSLVAWVAVYITLTRGGALRNPIGLTLILKSLLVAALFIPTALGLFFHLSVRDSHLVGWVDVILIGLVTPVMWWRSVVFMRIGPLPGRKPEPQDREGGPS